ncbi:hypothetical protein DESC_780194 [Desulfosarcina cetonica]|nr:hypothetical protein DESC_780194 [Desulfosarcina cetonica]
MGPHHDDGTIGTVDSVARLQYVNIGIPFNCGPNSTPASQFIDGTSRWRRPKIQSRRLCIAIWRMKKTRTCGQAHRIFHGLLMVPCPA